MLFSNFQVHILDKQHSKNVIVFTSTLYQTLSILRPPPLSTKCTDQYFCIPKQESHTFIVQQKLTHLPSLFYTYVTNGTVDYVPCIVIYKLQFILFTYKFKLKIFLVCTKKICIFSQHKI